MHRGVADHVIVKIDADIEGARRKIAALKKEAGAGPHVRTERRTGENYKAPGLKIAGGALTLVGGAIATKAPLLQAKAVGGLVALGGGALVLTADLIEQMEKLDIKTRRLNEVLETYRRNLATIAEMNQKAGGPDVIDGDVVDKGGFSEVQKLARSKNSAIVSGLAETWERLALVWGRMKRSGGASVYPERAQDILDDIQAVERALADISAIDNRSGAEDALSQVRKFLARTPPAVSPAPPGAPPAPFFGEGGEPQAGGRVMPRFLGLTSGFGGGVFGGGSGGGFGDDVLFGGAGSDTLRDTLRDLGVTTGDTEGSFTELNDEMGRYQAVVRSLASGLVDTNFLFGTQTERLRGLGMLLPDIGRQLIDVFDTGTEGATELDRSVAALGDRFLDAFEGAIRRGESLGDVLKSLARDLAELALQAVKSGDLFGGGGGSSGGGLLDSLFNAAVSVFNPLPVAGAQSGPRKGAKGLVFEGGNLTAFARGGAFTNRIVDRPTLFPMADGMGLMGEAGPEAVLPLTRLPNGELGVSMPPGASPAPAGPNITYYIDARGADREGLSRLAAVVRQQGSRINFLDRTMDRRAVNAVAWHRSRGPF